MKFYKGLTNNRGETVLLYLFSFKSGVGAKRKKGKHYENNIQKNTVFKISYLTTLTFRIQNSQRVVFLWLFRI